MPSLPTITLLLLVLVNNLGAELLANYQQGETSDSHLVRLPALFVEENQPATPLLDTGPFAVTYSGTLLLEKRQRLYFSFQGQGTVQLTLDGEEVLSESGTLGTAKSERLRLNSGEHSFQLEYQSPGEGEARFQLFWEERSFPREPIPPRAFGKTDPLLAKDALAYQGRELFGRHLCAKCHLPKQGFAAGSMPELAHIPPILGLTGDRLREPWLARWIANPRQFRPDTNMPRLVPNTEQGRQQAADLAAYLMTLKTGVKAPGIEGSPQEGGLAFHNLACVTCHGLPDDTAPSDNRVPLSHLTEKYQPSALRDFLLNPGQLSPHTRMPDFRLSEAEANNLTSYLLAQAPANEEETFPQGDPANGPELSQKMQCGACHAGLPYDSSVLPPFETIVKKPWMDAPCYQAEGHHLNLPEGAGEALESLRNEHLDSLQKDTPASLATRQLKNLRCAACHTRDDEPALLASLHSQSSHLAAHLESSEKVDQTFPRLTHVGEMLQSDALTGLLAGEAEPRPRPWLDARMPGFDNYSPKIFAEGLAAQHGLAPSVAEENEAAIDSIALGEKLIGSQEGFGCTACHGVGNQEPGAAFEVMGPNFDLSRHRLRKSFFYRWMHDPTRLTPNTKMPRYADEKGQTPLPDFDNDSRKQFEAIWDFLSSRE